MGIELRKTKHFFKGEALGRIVLPFLWILYDDICDENGHTEAVFKTFAIDFYLRERRFHWICPIGIFK